MNLPSTSLGIAANTKSKIHFWICRLSKSAAGPDELHWSRTPKKSHCDSAESTPWINCFWNRQGMALCKQLSFGFKNMGRVAQWCIVEWIMRQCSINLWYMETHCWINHIFTSCNYGIPVSIHLLPLLCAPILTSGNGSTRIWCGLDSSASILHQNPHWLNV